MIWLFRPVPIPTDDPTAVECDCAACLMECLNPLWFIHELVGES
jgi:hypothetical protein